MEELITTVDTKQITNKDLRTYTAKIKKCGDNIRKNYIKIAHLLTEVEQSECYMEDGYVDTIDYATNVLNIHKTTIYNLLRIGKDYLSDTGDGTILANDDGDYTISQIQALLPLDKEKVLDLAADKAISPQMSVRAIKSLVADLKAEEQAESDDSDTVDGDSGEEYEEALEEFATITFYTSGDTFIRGDGLPDTVLDAIQKVFKDWYAKMQP